MNTIKNLKDARKFAQKRLKQYKPYSIDTISHTIGTNVWIIQATNKEFEITLSLNSETGELLGEPQIHRTVYVNITEPPIHVSDSIHRTIFREHKITHWGWLSVSIGLTIVGSVISAFFDKYTGITISLIFGGLSIYYGRDAFIFTKEIDRA